MKIKELLLEVREVLDRFIYGYWIGPRNELIPITTSFGGHEMYVREHLGPQFELGMHDRYDEYALAHREGYIRIVHDSPESLSASGLAGDLRRVAPILLLSLRQPDIEYFYVDVFPPIRDIRNPIYPATSKEFQLPGQIGEAIRFLKSL